MSDKEEDEISLLDLFLVCLKYRKLIIFGTLSCMITFSVFFFIKENINPSKNISVVYTVKAKVIPPSLGSYMKKSGSLIQFARDKMNNLNFIAKANKSSYVFGGEGKSGYEYFDAVKESKEAAKFTIDGVKFDLEYEVKVDIDEELFSAYEVFLHTMLDEINKEAGNYFLSLFSDGLLSNVNEDIESEVNSYIINNSPLIYIDEEPVFISTATEGGIKIFIIVF
ncbi:MAG: hypothetical protein ACI4LS_00320, partial [Treponema sp.]